MMESLAVAILLVLAGYATQRGSICAVAAAREWVEDRRATRLTGFMLCAAVALLVMAVDRLAGGNVFALYHGLAITWLTITGSVVFALGAWLNRRCSLGTVAEFAAGDLTRLATIGGFLAGSWTIWHLAGRAMGQSVPSPLLAAPIALPLVTGLALTLALIHWLRRQLRDAPPPAYWSPIVAMTVIGAASGGLFCLDQEWPYTTFLGEVARGEAHELPKRLLFFATLLAGATAGAWRGAMFRLRTGPGSEWLRAAAGGLVMGGGAALVPGGNDAMLLTGIPLLLPNLVAAYATTTIALIMMVKLEQRSAAMRAVAQ